MSSPPTCGMRPSLRLHWSVLVPGWGLGWGAGGACVAQTHGPISTSPAVKLQAKLLSVWGPLEWPSPPTCERLLPSPPTCERLLCWQGVTWCLPSPPTCEGLLCWQGVVWCLPSPPHMAMHVCSQHRRNSKSVIGSVIGHMIGYMTGSVIGSTV